MYPDIVVMKIDSCKTIQTMDDGVAPTAFLIPNSFVLSLITKTIILEIPIIPASSVPIPTKMII